MRTKPKTTRTIYACQACGRRMAPIYCGMGRYIWNHIIIGRLRRADCKEGLFRDDPDGIFDGRLPIEMEIDEGIETEETRDLLVSLTEIHLGRYEEASAELSDEEFLKLLESDDDIDDEVENE